MTIKYEKNKEHIYKWRETHREAYNKYMLNLNLSRYESIKDDFNKKRREKYQQEKEYIKECRKFRNILL
jgi:hypothetical protein